MKPTLRLPDTTTQDAIHEALDYEPETGNLYWRQTRRNVTEGSLAGSIHPDGNLVVTFGGKPYQAHHIAWFFHTSEWPLYQVLFRDKDPLNLKPENLYLQNTAYKDTPKARQMRRYREQERQKRNLTSKISGVTYGIDARTRKGLWSARARWNASHVLASFYEKKDAEQFAQLAYAGYEWILAHPIPPLPADAKSIHAGTIKAIDMAEAHFRYAYDPHTGAIYRRWPDHALGVPAIELDDNRRPVIRASSRVYTAGMMAWFLTYGEWPKRKQLGYRDNNRKNTALDNLYLKGHSAISAS